MDRPWRRTKGKRRGSAAALVLRRAAMSRCGAGLLVKARRRQWSAGRLNAVERKFRELQALVPGGEGLHADQLFLRTAGYILHLRLQVNALQALSKLYVP